MKLEREATLGVWALILLVVLVAGSAIILLQRMSPAIGQILEENVASEEAVEEMLATLAEASSSGTGASSDTAERQRARFDDALDRARDNVTEPEEPALLEAIHLHENAAFAGDAAARATVVQNLRQLGAVNRASMHRSDVAARRLGLGGAWACTLLGVVGFGFGALILRRLRRRIELPIEDLRDTLQRVRRDDFQARCRTLLQAPAELAQIASHTNWLLDLLQLTRAEAVNARSRILHDLAGPAEAEAAQRTLLKDACSASQGRGPSMTTETVWTSSSLRAALVQAMDLDVAPRFLVDNQGAELGRNAAALGITAPTRGWPTLLDQWRAEPIGNTGLFWIRPAT